MAQHDYNIANQSGADFRADLNNALLAIATVNSGSTEPSTTFAHQLWVDTSSSVLKIRNAADNAWITTGVSITASNTFTGDLTGNVTGNLTGNVTGNVTGDLTGNADSADTLSTARTISLSGDVVGSVSFDGSSNVDIDTVVQINSITLGTDTTGDYVESMSGGTGVTVTGGTGEGSTPSVAIGQAVATTDDVTFNLVTATDEFVGDLDGAVRFSAKAGEALTKGDLVYVSGVSGNVPVVSKAKADDVSKMPVFGLAVTNANNNAGLQVATFGTLDGLNTSGVSEGQILYASTTAGAYTTTKPTGESSQIQNIGKVIRSHAAAGSIKIGGAGRSNDVPNLNNGKIFIGNASNQAITSTLDTSIVIENTNLYYTTTRANTDFDTRLATKDTGDLTEGSNLYYTTARVNSDFDTRLATKDTGDLTEGSNLYYTDARVNSAFDTRLATKDTDDVSEGTTNLYYTSGRANTDFDTRLATKSTTNLTEGTNLYYTTARFDSAFTSKDTDDLSEGTTNLYYTTTRFDSAFGNKTTADLTENTNLYYTDTRANSAIDARVTKAFVDALGIQATSVADNSVVLGNDTTGNYIQTVTGTANKITVSGSGSESADITLSLPDDVQIADSLTVAGNLTVNGTLTSLDTTNLDIEDNLFQLNAGLTGSPVNDSGMLINRGTADNGIFMWDESVDKFTLGLTTADGSATGNITLNSLGTLVANLEGAVTGTVSSLSNHDTDDLAEGLNLYYTDARSRAAISATGDISYDSSTGVISFTQSASPVTSVNTLTGAVVLDTDDIGEGSTNVYFTNARADTRINLQTGANLDLSSKSTSDLSEGSNLYYTDARVQAVSINNVVEDTTPQLGGNLASNGNDILFGDNDKAVFGAGSDLQIYHDGGNSFIKDTNAGVLFIEGSSGVYFRGINGEPLLNMSENGAVRLYHDNDQKLATTSTGIDVTGTATMDGLTVDGDVVVNTGAGALTVDSFGGGSVQVSSNGAYKHISTLSSGYHLFEVNSKSVAKFNNNGDISFYDDTGTSQALFWDASAESLGIATTSPQAGLDIASTAKGVFTSGNVYSYPTGNAYIKVKGTNAEHNWIGITGGYDQSSGSANLMLQPNFRLTSEQAGNYIGSEAQSVTTADITFGKLVGGSSTSTNATKSEFMRITSGGNVGIGTDNPDAMLRIDQDAAATGLKVTGGNGGAALAEFTRDVGSTGTVEINAVSGDPQIKFASANNTFSIGTNSTAFEIADNDALGTNARFTINSVGKVGIGTTNPTELLNVSNSSGNAHIELTASTTGTSQFTFGDSGGSFRGGMKYVHTDDELFLRSNGSDRLTIDSSGNVGIGDPSPAAKLEIKQGSSNWYEGIRINKSSLTTQFGTFSNNSGATFIGAVDTTGGDNNVIVLGNSTNGTTFDERMRINSSGCVGIGSTVDRSIGTNITTTVINGSAGGGLWLSTGDSSATTTKIYSKLDSSVGELIINQGSGVGGGSIKFTHNESATPTMTLQSNKNVLIGDITSDFITYGKLQVAGGGYTAGWGGIVGFFDTDGSVASSNLIQLLKFSGDTDATGGQFIRFSDSNSTMGSVSAASGTTVSYNTSSDRRMKENIVDASSQLEVINNIQIREFDWKKNGHHEVGLIAQELNEVIPNVVQEGGEDVNEEPWGVDYGKLTPYLVKAIQEQQAQIEALQSEINLLKGE